ncbi:hypothetical protein TRFO_01444 [Tritrichomonas foetus]|uniref:Uncharacterized protein n=1 Tax=Tritrichomonas foetus TaxID=1144522 RepID=A0A1J4K220_9EUKA|nr:hypothetical protein TRFO_01444 [Tritrichomonas foetus]|eukprot:OHT03782.1 hypothetical protein TRFO_01444 [Tritrichomonas foetus]
MNVEQNPDSDTLQFNPRNCVKVISTSTTFYPLDGRNEEGLTIINSMAFLNQNFGETVTSFSANDQTIVLQMWNGLLFYIAAKNTTSEQLLRFMLQICRDIAIFLFGAHFENHMAKNIVQSLRETYAKYIEKFFELCNQDYKYMLMVPEMAPECSDLSKHIKDHNPFTQGAIDSSFVECVLFRNHKIVGRYNYKQSSNKKLQPKDIFQVSLSERIEFSNSTFSEDITTITDSQTPNIIYKGGNLTFDGIPQTCFLASVQLGTNSPFVAVFIFKNDKPTPEISEQLNHIIKKLILLINEFGKTKKVVKAYQITGLLHYLMINRSTGEYYESLKPSTNDPIITKLQRKMASVAMAALQTGNFTLIRNHMLFQYTYEMKFRKKGTLLTPNEKLKNQDSEVSYKRIVEEQFHNDSSIQCYELMTVYLGVMNTKDVAKANQHLFDTLLS